MLRLHSKVIVLAHIILINVFYVANLPLLLFVVARVEASIRAGIILVHLVVLAFEILGIIRGLLPDQLPELGLDRHHVGVEALLLLNLVVIVEGLYVQFKVPVFGVLREHDVLRRPLVVVSQVLHVLVLADCCVLLHLANLLFVEREYHTGGIQESSRRPYLGILIEQRSIIVELLDLILEDVPGRREPAANRRRASVLLRLSDPRKLCIESRPEGVRSLRTEHVFTWVSVAVALLHTIGLVLQLRE